MVKVETISERINKLISELGIKQISFAKSLNVSQAFVSKLCSGLSSPSDRTIADICRVYNVNEEWLRFGHGGMFRTESQNERLLRVLVSATDTKSPALMRAIILALGKLQPEQWKALEAFICNIEEELQKEKTGRE